MPYIDFGTCNGYMAYKPLLLRSRFGIWLVETMDRCRVRTFTGYCFPEFKLQAVGPYRDKGARLYT